MHDGLYYLDNDPYHTVAAALPLTPLEEVLLQHRRLGHLSFATMGQLYPDIYSKVSKENLVCDACQYGKQTRSSYTSSDNRSDVPLQTIHSDVWGPSGVVSLNGYRYFVTFIDCCTRTTWVYVLRSKNEVFECFKDFHNLIKTQYNACMKVLRSDNGTEFVNKELDGYLSSHGIIHQTTCPGTSEQNGLAERKNRHLLEIARCLMFAMNVPKFLWCEAVMTAAYLMNRMPTRVLDYKTPIECLTGKNTYAVPPKVFGCTCFVRDYRPSVGKLDPRALKSIFVGYFSKQKGYKCWCPSARRMFVSMDVVFREHEPFYGEATDLTDVFPDLLSNDIPSLDCKAGEDKEEKDSDEASHEVVVGVIPDEDNTIEIEQVQREGEPQGSVNRDLRWSKPNEERNPQVYTRRHKSEEKEAQGEQFRPLGHDSESQVQVDSRDSTSHEGTSPPLYDDLDVPIAHRKQPRNTARNLPSRLSKYVVSNHVSYSLVGPKYRSFIASLDSTASIPRDWQEAKKDPRWRAAMLE
jgi:transposase InsO family protein